MEPLEEIRNFIIKLIPGVDFILLVEVDPFGKAIAHTLTTADTAEMVITKLKAVKASLDDEIDRRQRVLDGGQPL